MKAPFTITLICLLAFAGCLEIKSSVFDTHTELSRNWNHYFHMPEYNLAAGDVVRFALFTDSHHNYHDLNETINHINESGNDFAVFLGDFSDIGSRDEYEIFHSFLRDITISTWIVPGNHDLATLKEKLFTRVFGAENHAIVASFGKMIFWNSNALELRPKTADLDWLDGQVSSANASEPVFIFQHQDPLNNLTYTPSELTRINTILNSHPEVYVFHGHLHRFDTSNVGTALTFQVSRVEGHKWAYVEVDNTGVRVFYCTKRNCNRVH